MRFLDILRALLAPILAVLQLIVSVPIDTLYGVRRTGALRESRFLLRAGDEVVVVSGAPEPHHPRALIRLGEGDPEPVAALSESWSWCGFSEGLLPRGDNGWWYSRCEGGIHEFAIRMITPDGGSSLVPVDVSPETVRGWLPIAGGDQEGVLLSLADENDSDRLRVQHVTAAGVKDLGILTRNDRGAVISPQRWQALRLDEHRIAVVSLEYDLRSQTSFVMQRIFGGEEIEETVLVAARNRTLQSLATARDGGGKIVVVVLDSRGVDAFIDGHVKTLTENLSDTNAGLGEMRLLPVHDRLIAAWVQPVDHTLRIVEFNAAFAHPPAVVAENVGTEAAIALAVRDGEVEVLWADAGQLARRRLPEQPTGYLAAADLFTWAREDFAERERAFQGAWRNSH
ncbi:MAG TPA: hypothetical protein VFN10_14895 [Thermoanaerobaculia bacterium]|nr:hypothetical protein [Thermoanaerobaculia bacterium]